MNIEILEEFIKYFEAKNTIGLIGANYIHKDKVKEKIDLVREEKAHYIDLIDDYNAQICDEIIEALEELLEGE